MDDVLLVQAVLDLTGFGIGNSLANVGGNGASLRVRHQTTRSEDLTQAANAAHHIRGGNQNVEVQVAALDLGDQIIIANFLSTSSLSSLSSVALADSNNANVFASAVGQNNSAADLLISMAAVNAKADMQLNGLVELGLSGLAAQLQGFLGLVGLGTVDQLSAVDIMFTVIHYFIPPLW